MKLQAHAGTPTRGTKVFARLTIGALAVAGLVSVPVPMTAPLAAAADSAAAITVDSLHVENLVQPLGIDDAKPRLAWVDESSVNGTIQSAYEVKVSSSPGGSGDVWSSGKTASTDSYEVVYDGPALKSKTRYYGTVRVWDGNDTASDWADEQWFETAFLDPDEFAGDWIGRLAARPTTETPEALLRTEFDLAADKTVKSARVYIAGLGYHKAYLNGTKIGDHELDPAYTPFDKLALYVTHDVTDMLATGTNALAVSLGRGNYSAYGDSDISAAPWLSEPELKLELDITYTDGTTEQVTSDPATWTADDGPTVKNGTKAGETYDARLEQDGWNDTGFDDTGWDAAVATDGPPGSLASQDMEPIRVVGNMKTPVAKVVDSDTTIYDFQAVRAGWATMDFTGNAGDVVTIKYAEKLNADGTVNQGGGFGNAIQTYQYTLSGDGEDTFTPSYSYSGFQYVQVDAPASVEVTDITGQLLNNDVDVTSTFDSSDELFNRYHQAMITSTLSNLHGIPTDTPMYEKRGWMADAHLISDNALMNLTTTAFWEKWMTDIRNNQADNGGVPVIVPNQLPGQPQADPFIGKVNDSVWGSAYVLVSYALYEQRGDVGVLRDNYDGMNRWMDYWIDILENSSTPYINLEDTWGDHEPAYGGGRNNRIVATAYVYEPAVKMADIATVLGDEDRAAELTDFAGKVKNAINERYYDAEAKAYFTGAATDANQFQTNNVLPLELDLVPAEDRDDLCQNLYDDIVETQDNHVTTGATVLKDFLPVVTACGFPETAFDVATNPTSPGWGYFFQDPKFNEDAGNVVDTFFEAWYDTTRSHNHAFRGTVDDWLIEDVVGIETTSAGYRTIDITPTVVGGMTHANASIESPLGTVSSSWKTQDGTMDLDVQIPVGATATVNVPVSDGQSARAETGELPVAIEDGVASFELTSGHYSIHTGLAPEKLGSPVVVGSYTVGQTLTCTPGTWSDVKSFRYAWVLDGATIDGATKDTLSVADDYAGHDRACTVVAVGKAGETAATSASVTIARPESGKVASTTSISLSDTTVHYGTARSAVVTVAANGAPAAGNVNVYIDGSLAGTAPLGPAGAATVALPADTPVGTHAVTAVFASTATTQGSTAGAALNVTKATSRLQIKLNRSVAKAGSKVRAKVSLKVPGLPVDGRVRLSIDGKKIRTVKVTDGAATVPLPAGKLGVGSHRVKAAFAGSASVSAAHATAKIRITRR